MRRLLLLLFIIPIASAEFEPVERTIQVGESMEEYGRVLELLSVADNGQIVVRIDNNKTQPVTDTATIDGVKVNVTEFFYVPNPSERKAKIKMTVKWKHLCDTDADCYTNQCVINKCTGWPRSCEYDDSSQNITTCEGGDGCCPPVCNWLSDSDCEKPCYKDRDCEDNDPGTIDSCDGTAKKPGLCQYEPLTECEGRDDFCPANCEYGYGPGEDSDCSQTNECSNSQECTTSDPGMTGACIGYGTIENPRVCVYSNVTACISNDDFCPPGCTEINDNDCPHTVKCGDAKCEPTEDCSTCAADCGCTAGLICSGGECLEEVRVCDNIGERSNLSVGGEFYCTESGWKIVKAGGSVCEDNYECKSSTCGSDKKCVSISIIKEERSRNFALTLLGIFLLVVAAYFVLLRKISKKAEGFNKI